MRTMFQLLGNRCLIAPITAWLLAQLIKFFLTALCTGRCVPQRLVGSGGMPSAHAATVCALAASIALTSGVGGESFALAAVTALVVMYDACGVRREAGRHAQALNELNRREEEGGNPIHSDGPFHELVGHTLPQVALGGVLGVAVALAVCRFWPLSTGGSGLG